MPDSKIKLCTLPTDDRTRDGIFNIYRTLFGAEEVDIVRDIYAGKETNFSRNEAVIAQAEDGRIVGTAMLSQDLHLPEAGTLNGVGVLPEARGQKIAERCCAMAVERLDSYGVKGTFLGTSNPLAARLYQRLGFRFLPASRVMLRLADTSDDAFKFFKNLYPDSACSEIICPGDAGCRIALIPLIVACSGGQLDPLADLFGAPMSLVSCQGLYPKYEKLVRGQGGKWFQMRNRKGAMVAVGSSKPLRWKNGENGHWLNVMAHPDYPEARQKMLDFLLALPENQKTRVKIPVNKRDSLWQNILVSRGLNPIGCEMFSWEDCIVPFEVFG